MTDEEMQAFIDAVPWRFAATMPAEPHEYTHIKYCDRERFHAFVLAIRARGYSEQYKGRKYTYLNVGKHRYWTMGAPVDRTVVINRAEL